MSRSSEPSARVAQILDEHRDPRPLELPSTLAGGRYRVGSRAVIGVTLVVLLAVAMLAGRYLLAQRDAAPEPVGVVQESGGAETGEGAPGEAAPGGTPSGDQALPGASGSPESTASPSKVTVHVVGQVRRPGVVTLAAGSRVDDALERAGGATGKADLGAVNLARPLVDGEQVVVPAPGEETTAAGPAGATGPGGAVAPGAAPGAPAGAGGTGLVDLNSADLATLETLPGVGPVLAQRIIDWRIEHGRFAAVEELGEVSGIGDKIYAQLSSKVTV